MKEVNTHHQDGIRLGGITEKLEPSKLPFTSGREEYGADADCTVGCVA
jgi:hypothetical protein